MQMQAMEASLHHELLEGEELLWSGRPDQRKRATISPNRVFVILGAIFVPLGILSLFLGLALFLIMANIFPNLVFFIVGGVFTLLGVIYLLVGSLAYSPSRRELYAITNRRVIIVRSGRRYTITSSYDRKAITQVHRVERGDESGDLVFGGTPLGGYGYSQSNASTIGIAGISRSGIFYAIPNVRLVEKTLLSMLNDT